MLPLQARVDLGVMAMKGCFPFPKVLANWAEPVGISLINKKQPSSNKDQYDTFDAILIIEYIQ